MTMDPNNIQLINFDSVQSTNELLRRIGIKSDLGAFLADHVGEVLRKQHRNAAVRSIELTSSEQCTIEGEHRSDGSIVKVASITIPMAMSAVVSIGNERYILDLRVIIRANAVETGFDAESDVLIVAQSKM